MATEMKPDRVVQILADSETFVCLCENGTLWRNEKGFWSMMQTPLDQWRKEEKKHPPAETIDTREASLILGITTPSFTNMYKLGAIPLEPAFKEGWSTNWLWFKDQVIKLAEIKKAKELRRLKKNEQKLINKNSADLKSRIGRDNRKAATVPPQQEGE